jgi:hypothetical protein
MVEARKEVRMWRYVLYGGMYCTLINLTHQIIARYFCDIFSLQHNALKASRIDC